MSFKISVFTVCMPEYTPEEGAEALRKWGFDGVEWRITNPPALGAPVENFWSGNRCTIDPATIVEIAPKLGKLCRKHRLAMPVLASYLSYKDMDLAERVLEAAAMMGVKAVRIGVDSYDGSQKYNRVFDKCLKGYDKIVRLGEKYKVKPLAEIHMGNIIPSASAAFRFAENFGYSDMGVIYDPGNMVYEGYEQWKMGLELLGRYVGHVHIKNASKFIESGDPDGNLRWGTRFDSLRHGQVNWAEVIDALVSIGYRGWLSMEDFSPGATETKLTEGLAYIRGLIKNRRAAGKSGSKSKK